MTTTTIEKVVSRGPEAWQRALEELQTGLPAVYGHFKPFSELMNAGYTKAMSQLLAEDDFQMLHRCRWLRW